MSVNTQKHAVPATMAAMQFVGPGGVDQLVYRHYVHPGVICRSTTGPGTSARLALMRYEGSIRPGDRLESVSLRETGFIGTFVDTHQDEGMMWWRIRLPARGLCWQTRRL